MKALITGGGGFLGSRIAQLLKERGDEVTVLGRRAYPHHEQAGIRTIQTDIRESTAIRQACEGMETVFHVAAIPGIWARRKIFQDINVGGTRNVIDACKNAGVSRLVHTSTPSVVFGESPLCGVDESQPYPQQYLADYPETKAAAERMVLAANSAALSTIALRPHLIWGPGDPHLIPRVIDRARRGQLRIVGDGENLVDITFIDNAAEAHLRAADALTPKAACAGRAYFISQGEPVKLWPWLNGILVELGIPPVERTISYNAARRAGAVLEAVHRVFCPSREPRMTRFLASQLAYSHYFNISAARADFGYEPRVSTSEGLAKLIRSLRRD